MSPAPARTDHNIWPLFTSDNALALREFLKNLGFEEGVLIADGQHVQHSEMVWPEGGRLMVCTARPDDPDMQPAGVGNIYIVTDNPDRVHDRAVNAGVEITVQLQNTDYGSRDFGVRTPDGHTVSFGTYAGESD
ncbi:VOC family protein [Corynebacterium halotolerans]|uniref:VOC family protein n=1 Tax=Corynebacterium halotolerans TaxID=225326 RepID=UPI003CE69C6D